MVGLALTMVTLVITMVTDVVAVLAAKLQPEEHEETQQNPIHQQDSGTPDGPNQTKWCLTTRQPCSRPKGKPKVLNWKTDHEQEVLILVLFSRYTRCVTLTFRPHIWSAHATKAEHTCTGDAERLSLFFSFPLN